MSATEAVTLTQVLERGGFHAPPCPVYMKPDPRGREYGEFRVTAEPSGFARISKYRGGCNSPEYTLLCDSPKGLAAWIADAT